MRFLITGGAGFIGSNAARRFRELGHDVVVFDSFVRAASRFNRAWLESLHPDIRFIEGDVRDAEALRALSHEPFDVVLHLAGQVAVTTSIVDPVTDYEINALGTFRLLEELRRRHAGAPERAPLLIYASTNKVYGHLSMGETIRDGRWDFQNLPTGVSETEPLSFESPYGCSKGAADQYVDRLPPQLRPSDRRHAAILHLRAAAVRRRGPGLGRVVRAGRGASACRSRSTATGCRSATSSGSTTSWRSTSRRRRSGTRSPAGPTTSEAARASGCR